MAPSTTPTTLYLLEKNLIQSFRTPFSLSGRSFHSGATSSGFVEVIPRAREASLPAKTWKNCQYFFARFEMLWMGLGKMRLGMVGFTTKGHMCKPATNVRLPWDDICAALQILVLHLPLYEFPGWYILLPVTS